MTVFMWHPEKPHQLGTLHLRRIICPDQCRVKSPVPVAVKTDSGQKRVSAG